VTKETMDTKNNLAIEYQRKLVSLKQKVDDFEVEFEIMPFESFSEEFDERRIYIKNEISNLDEQIEKKQNEINTINQEIDRLTNHADALDYTVSVSSGILCGLIDSFFVGEFSFERGQEWGKEKIDNLVKAVAKKQGYEGDDLAGSIRYMEKYGTPSDSATADFGGGRQHHLRDFAHHPTPIGLIFSMITQFTCTAYGTDTIGNFQAVPITDKTFIGKELPEKITFGFVFWIFHMVSDMAGSSGSAAIGSSGTGLPGPLVSLLKELSSLPIFNKTNDAGNKEFSVWISKLFNGTLLAEHDENGKIIPETVKPFDLRAEIGVAKELSRQAIPIIINECIVRGFYFIRRLHAELKEKQVASLSDLKKINWKNTLPFKNRTIIRMLTVSIGTFCVIDMADAAIRGAIKSGGKPAIFAGNFLLHVNFIGVGRFAIAVFSDVKMGVQRNKSRDERIDLVNEQIHLINAKVFYKQADMWISAESAIIAIDEAYRASETAGQYFIESFYDIEEHLDKIEGTISTAEENNPGLTVEILDVLKWGNLNGK
jgi:cell division protein FtsL